MKLEMFEDGRRLKITVRPFWINLQFARTAEEVCRAMWYQTARHFKIVTEEFENDFPNATKNKGLDVPECYK